MFNLSVLRERIVNSLLKREFEVFITRGCFDIAAKREKLMLIKSLVNIDGLNPQQAQSLRAASYFLTAYPFVVSMRTNRGFLTDDLVYSRFAVPVVTPKMFEDIIEEEAYSSKSAKGRHTVEIDTGALRAKRYELKFTLEELANLIGLSKKALYEIEKKRTNPTEHTVKKLERVLKIELRNIYKPQPTEQTCTQPANELQKTVSKELGRMGVENSPVQHAPFEIAGKESTKENFSLITGLSANTTKIKREAGAFKKLSGIFSSSAFFVAKRTEEKLKRVEGVPVLLEEELPEIESAKELKKIIEESSDE
jgi:putative transcriptional regulator